MLLGLRLFDKISVPRHAPGWLGDAHRLVGTIAFLLTLPVAYQCLWALGFQSTDTRVLVHSILGCFFYGVFTVKVLAVRIHGLPAPTLPLVGGFVFAALVGVWLTSALLVLHVAPRRHPGVLMFRRIVNVVEVLAVVAAAVFVRAPVRQRARLAVRRAGDASPGAQVFAATAPAVTEPTAAAAPVRNSPAGGGRSGFPTSRTRSRSSPRAAAGMPSFGGQLSPAEIHKWSSTPARSEVPTAKGGTMANSSS